MASLIVANWKMNGLGSDGIALAGGLADRKRAAPDLAAEIVLCPPATLISLVGGRLGSSGIGLGGQDCHAEPAGAFTGDVSAPMLADLGCRWVILGHSERRVGHGETDAVVRSKVTAAHATGLTAIVCVGESAAEREAGTALAVVDAQLGGSLPEGSRADNTVIAYEPIWAIGTGRTPTNDDVARVHAYIIDRLTRRPRGDRLRVLYGGSVKAGNAAELLAIPGVAGALVGGASLKLDEFWAICRSCR
ncbi:MAG: triose-phosphate isomerase [Proteobacteria bacterium]|nr:triose-phosphate isomerase [Pseudomonadota bacterium]MBI3496043.1 triose-phosphate isomerase [Pseudomonadota bacterium]